MHFGFTINRTQQKVIAAYLVLVVVLLLWRIDDHLARIERRHRQQMVQEYGTIRPSIGPIGQRPDRGDDVVNGATDKVVRESLQEESTNLRDSVDSDSGGETGTDDPIDEVLDDLEERPEA